MQEELNLLSSGAALEELCRWGDSLKSFQQRLGKYYARSEARLAAFDYTDGLASPYCFSFGCRSFPVGVALSGRTPTTALNPALVFGSHRGWLFGCIQSGPWALVRLSLAELKRWLWRLLFPRSWSLAPLFHWPCWRRHHQALARYHHYRQRAQAPEIIYNCSADNE
ncbi:hypothetical protein [Chroococcidiopsis sp. CCMEE 29]|uniref:hypothetical protein n=1 Tax=Chroococcidiopsis sp. CCMEE 29 TaxID=155894 RepID=UPI0020215662|nr:hypothetical protein [Chroococcidiopsis sp. CCMEE 29]